MVAVDNEVISPLSLTGYQRHTTGMISLRERILQSLCAPDERRFKSDEYFNNGISISTKPTVGLVGVRWRPEQAQVEADMWLERGDSRR